MRCTLLPNTRAAHVTTILATIVIAFVVVGGVRVGISIDFIKSRRKKNEIDKKYEYINESISHEVIEM